MDAIGIKIAQIITVASGGFSPSDAQVAGWEAYWQAGHPLTEIAAAFVQSTAFAHFYNNDTPVDPNSAAAPAILQEIINSTVGVHGQSQVDAWAATGLSTAQVLADFALGDQYSQAYFYNTFLGSGDGAGITVATGNYGGNNLVLTDTSPASIVGIVPITSTWPFHFLP